MNLDKLQDWDLLTGFNLINHRCYSTTRHLRHTNVAVCLHAIVCMQTSTTSVCECVCLSFSRKPYLFLYICINHMHAVYMSWDFSILSMCVSLRACVCVCACVRMCVWFLCESVFTSPIWLKWCWADRYPSPILPWQPQLVVAKIPAVEW